MFTNLISVEKSTDLAVIDHRRKFADQIIISNLYCIETHRHRVCLFNILGMKLTSIQIN